LRRLQPREVAPLRRAAIDASTLAAAAAIVEDVRLRGEAALREHAERLGDVAPGAPLVVGPDGLAAALASLDASDRAVLERTAARIKGFALAQRNSIRGMEMAVPGGRAGHAVVPVDAAGCYAPGGRFPLPSSVLMTAVTARAAGVGRVWVASPRPTAATLAAAAVAGADAVLAVGGAQAIAALAHGAGPVPPCDAVVGPGNRWVTAAKQLVAGHVTIDMLAGPSELVVLADDEAGTRVGFDAAAGTLFLDRTDAGTFGHGAFARRFDVPVVADEDGAVSVRVIVDRGSVEVFAMDGRAVLTGLAFPAPGADAVRITTGVAGGRVDGLVVRPLRPPGCGGR